MTATAELTFTEVAPDDEAGLRRWYDVVTACHTADRPDDPLPGYAAWAGQLRTPMPQREPHLVLAEVDGEVVGWFAQWLPTGENTDTSPGELEVHPRHRRCGHGRAMVAEWARRAASMGRARLLAEAAEGAGAAFATTMGFRAALVDTQRRLDLTVRDEGGTSALLAEALSHSRGYSLLRWCGATPEEHLAAAAALESRMTTDSPMDDLRWEQEVFDVERIRERDRIMTARLTRAYTTAAVHDATAALVGYTTVVVHDGADDGAYQHQTIVLPEHRGHRLGLLLKLTNLELLRRHEPAVRSIDTWNADSNAPMLRVNLAMGFEVVRQWSEYERQL